MITLSEATLFVALPIIATAILFTVAMIFLRSRNFDSQGKRIDDWRKLENDLLSQQIEYHNNAVYKAFEFYIKIILAIFGGISYVALVKQDNNLNAKLLIHGGGLITIGVGCFFCLLVFSHQKAKIERWKKCFEWYEPLIWNECWFATMCITLSAFTYGILIPKMISNLESCAAACLHRAL